ncbi:ClpXP protease specificity-enhancing factor [Marilutibacter aestuarii]|uniref:ClpXP protease specificity-enhancing factor n=1 Tax=Marilutibacter aestuarii TaxID=1706195 RepID=A0A508ARI7_9GAMM|nr:ClpXP protease specificity-enhancing factor [Lysobacter aestuarii]TQD51563.1 ClpXP protease specificity-enhancing factor [Lysobacter aestuarii]
MTDDSPGMTSHRPYLLRALYEWIADNDMTPHLLVDATRQGVRVPSHAVSEGKIVLNIAHRAVSHLEMGNHSIDFSARFGGVSQAVSVPVSAVLAIYSRETGQGMALPDDSAMAGSGGDAGPDDASGDAAGGPPSPALSAVPSERAPEGDGDGDDDGPPSGPRRTGHLRVVK